MDINKPNGESSIVFTDDMPGPQALKHRTETSIRVLQLQGIQPVAIPIMTSWQMQGLRKLLVHKGLITEAEFDYFTAFAQTLDLERLTAEVQKNKVQQVQGIIKP